MPTMATANDRSGPVPAERVGSRVTDQAMQQKVHNGQQMLDRCARPRGIGGTRASATPEPPREARKPQIHASIRGSATDEDQTS
jgi:hypothetical protein